MAKNKIPKPIPKPDNPVGYTSQELLAILSKSEYSKFRAWMSGQTTGVSDSGEGLYYPYDVKRFINKIRHGGPDFWD